MIGRVSKLGMVIAAVLALGALVATSASAELGYRTCIKATKVGKTYTGKFNDKACTEANGKGEGKYEAQPVAEGTTFTGKTKVITITAAGKTVICKKGTGAGEFLSEVATSEEFTFSGCGVNGSKKAPCQTPAAGAGVIKTSALHAKPVYLDSGETTLGTLILSFEPVMQFNCGAEAVTVEGRVVAGLENNKKGMKLTLATSGGQQEHKSFWVEGEEFGPFTLFTEPGEAEATISVVIENGPKGVSAA